MPEATNPLAELAALADRIGWQLAESFEQLAAVIFGGAEDMVRRAQLRAIPWQVECGHKHGDENLTGLNALRAVGGWRCPKCGAVV